MPLGSRGQQPGKSLSRCAGATWSDGSMSTTFDWIENAVSLARRRCPDSSQTWGSPRCRGTRGFPWSVEQGGSLRTSDEAWLNESS